MIALERSRSCAQQLRYEAEVLRLNTQLAEAESQFTKSNEDLKAALSEKENFILRFSHEIRNPLNSLLGNIELVTEICTEEKTLEMLRDARICGEILLQLLNNVLDIAKISSHQLEVSIGTSSVKEFMEKMWVVCAEIVRKKGLVGTLSLDLSTPEYLDFDKHRLMQIMINMVSNATKFTDQGYVKIYSEFVPGDQIDPIDMKPRHLSRVGCPFPESAMGIEEYQNPKDFDERESCIFDTLTAASKRFMRGNSADSTLSKNGVDDSLERRTPEGPGYLRIEIIDSGCGMTAEQTSNLFKKFGQVNGEAHKRQIGTGLGLWITKELVELMDGKIEVYSAANFGTCFVIMIKSHSRLPCLPIKKSTAEDNGNTQSPRKEVNCIVVEAIAYNQEINRKFLEKCRISNICAVSNGNEAFELFKTKPPQYFSFILMDLDTPLVDGKGACERIRNHERELGWEPCKIIACTAGSDDDLTKTELLDANGPYRANGFLSKPASFDTILNTLKDLDIIDKEEECIISRVSSKSDLKLKKDNMKVLIAEDDMFNLDMMKKMLNTLGFDCLVACNGAEAIKAFETNRKEIKFILMDCEMPILDGFEATRQISKIRDEDSSKSRVPIFGLTGHCGHIYETRAKENGMQMLLTKPISMNQLRSLFNNENLID